MPPLSELPRRGARFEPAVDGHLKISGPCAPDPHETHKVIRDPEACKVYAPGGTEVYFGHFIDCRELMEMCAYTNEPPAKQIAK